VYSQEMKKELRRDLSDLQTINILLHHFEVAEENHIDDTRAQDRYSEATV
jgi:hypothetical protein